jgi:hypothetical protein
MKTCLMTGIYHTAPAYETVLGNLQSNAPQTSCPQRGTEVVSVLMRNVVIGLTVVLGGCVYYNPTPWYSYYPPSPHARYYPPVYQQQPVYPSLMPLEPEAQYQPLPEPLPYDQEPLPALEMGQQSDVGQPIPDAAHPEVIPSVTDPTWGPHSRTILRPFP